MRSKQEVVTTGTLHTIEEVKRFNKAWGNSESYKHITKIAQITKKDDGLHHVKLYLKSDAVHILKHELDRGRLRNWRSNFKI